MQTSVPNRVCSVCETPVEKFRPLPQHILKQMDKYGYIHSIFATETLNLFEYTCPHCGASDRDRLYALYLKEQFSNNIKHSSSEKIKIIDFAPSAPLATHIRSYNNITYRSADLYMEQVDDTVDLQNMKDIYTENQFDLFICSHLLEHIPNDRAAMKELYRILKPGGWGILMVPIVLTLETTHEDPSIVTPEERWKYYGQDDHVRTYAKKEFVERLEHAGFIIEQLDNTHFGKDSFQRHGIHPRSVLYIGKKPQTT